MKRKKELFFIVLSFLLGAFFIFSAWSKTTPNLQYFEGIIHNQLYFTDEFSALLARFFIGLEAALGIMMCLSVYGRKKWILKACLLLLVAFSVHLVLLWIRQGSNVDCGCMGNIIKMNPLVSLIKNVVLMALVLWLLFNVPTERNIYNHILSIIVSVIIVVVPFVIFPIQPRTMPMSKLYSSDQPMQPKEELRTGKHIVCFMSLTCPHCRAAAKIIHKIHEADPHIPFYIFFPHADDDTMEPEELSDFMQHTQVRQIPYSFIKEETFINMIKAAGEDGVPTMLWMQDTTIIRKMGVLDLEKQAQIVTKMKSWLVND